MKDKQLRIVEEDIVEEDIVDEVDTGEIVQANIPTTIQPTQMSLDKLMEMSKMLSKSTIVPISYQNREENVFIALDLANRMGISPMTVMQNLFLINGKPSFSGSFTSALIKSSPLFSEVKLMWVGEEGKGSYGAYVRAIDNRTGEEIKGVTVTLNMASQEGWMKNPKWKSMPELMLSYRAYSFFGRVHGSELLNGIYGTSEVEDFTPSNRVVIKPDDPK